MNNEKQPLRVWLIGVGLVVSAFAQDEHQTHAMKFYNQANEALSLTLEESCLPSYGAAKIYELKPAGSALVYYDASVANCVLIVPKAAGLGRQSSLFVLEPAESQPHFSSSTPTCRVEITIADQQHGTYDLKTSCMRVVSKGHRDS